MNPTIAANNTENIRIGTSLNFVGWISNLARKIKIAQTVPIMWQFTLPAILDQNPMHQADASVVIGSNRQGTVIADVDMNALPICTFASRS